MCSPRKYYPPPNRGQFCFRPPAPWNFHSRGCLSYPPHFPWNSCSVKSAVAPYYYPKDNCLCYKTEKKRFIHVNPRTYMQINTPTVEQGGWMDPPPPQRFWYVAVFRNDFNFRGKPLIFPTRWGMFYWWWHCWGACDVINNGRHLGRHLGFYQELEIRRKPHEMAIFLRLRWKITRDLLLLLKKIEKTCTLTQKWFERLLLMTSYLVTIETDHHWTWLKCPRGMNEQVLMFYPQGENSEKPPCTSEG